MKSKVLVFGQIVFCLTLSIGCKTATTADSLEAQSGSQGSKFKNGAVCGNVLARPDHELSEMPVTLTSGGQTRFVTLKGGAFDRLLKFVKAGEKTICLNADWADAATPTLESFVLVSLPDFHGPEGGSFKNGAVCGKVQARPDHELSEMPVTLTSGGQTRFVTLKGGAFDRLLKFVKGGEKTICLNADWADIATPTLESFVLVSVPDFHGPEGGQ